jgi:acetyl esterase/lipase
MLRTLANLYTADDTAPLVSLVRAELHCLPPLLIQVGTSEVLLDEAPGAIERTGAFARNRLGARAA